MVLRTLATRRRVARVLDCAPDSGIQWVLRHTFPDASYVGMDYLEPSRPVDLLADLTCLPFTDDAFDLAVCYHVLEHVPDDSAAIRELARVLSPRGVALVQVPYRPGGPTDEDPSAPAEERIRRFGQADHVRWYGNDFPRRLQAAGLRVRAVRPDDLLTRPQLARYGVSPSEPVWLAGCGERAPDPLRLLADVDVRGGHVPHAPPPGRRGLARLFRS